MATGKQTGKRAATGAARPAFNVRGTVTGRTQCAAPNDPAATEPGQSEKRLLESASAEATVWLNDVLSHAADPSARDYLSRFTLSVLENADITVRGIPGGPDARAAFAKLLAKCLRVAATQVEGEPGADPLPDHVAHASSNVASSAYDPTRRILEVTFNNGGRYRYVNVPRGVRDQMLAAESVGSFMAKVVKPGYAFEKVAG